MSDAHKDPLDLHGKPQVLAAQRAVDAAWADVEEYRRAVDAARRDGGEPRPWTPEEDAEFDRRRAAVLAARQERARVMAEAGLTSTFDSELQLRVHSREAPADAAG